MERRPAAELAFLLAAILAFYHPFLTAEAMLSGGDAANLFWPVRQLVHESLWQKGIVPLWNPWSYGGAPLAASMQHAVFYPPDWLFFGLLPAHVAMNAVTLFHLLLAGAGMWFLLRFALLLPGSAALLGGFSLPCAAWFWGHLEHVNQIAAGAWIPWQIALAWMLASGRLEPRRFIVCFAVTSAFQFFAGHPQEAFYGHLASAAALLLPAGPFRRRFLPFVAAEALFVLLVAVQLLPTLELDSVSRRQFRDPTYAISFSMPPDVLRTYISPHAFGSFRDGYYVREGGAPVIDSNGNPLWDRRAYGEYGLFIGLPALLLALAGVVSRGAPLRTRLGLLVLFAATLALALGGNTDPRRLFSGDFTEFPEPGWSLHELFLRIVPPAQGFRVPARTMLIGAVALLALAAIGYSALLRTIAAAGSPAAKRWAIAATVLALQAASLYLPSRREKFHFLAPVDGMIAALASDRRDDRTLDNRLHRLTSEDDNRLIRERHLETTFIDGEPLGARMRMLQPHMNVPARIPIIDGYEEGLVPTARMKDFQHAFNRNFRQFRPDPQLLTLLGISTILSELPIDSETFPPVPDPVLGRNMYRNPNARGSAYYESAVKGIDFRKIDGPFWQGGEPLPGISREEVSYGTLDWAAWHGAPALRTELPTVNRIEVKPVATPGAGDALVALGFAPGWKVGSQELEFPSAVIAQLPEAERGGEGWSLAYRPGSYRTGLFLTAIGAMVLGFVAAWGYRTEGGFSDTRSGRSMESGTGSKPPRQRG
jgi:hypothetical protein